MPTSTHDIFTELVVQEVGSQLKNVACGDTDLAAVVDLVRSESTSDVYLYGHEPIDGRYPKHTPDASFAHAGSQYPSIVIETSYSQHQEELARLADEYICGSDGNIGVVLGLDIAYGVGSKRASISIWRPSLAPDPQNKEGVILKTVGVQEADVLSSCWTLIEIFATLMLINFVFGSRFAPTTEPLCKAADCRSSFVTLCQGLASPMCLQVHKT